MDFDETTGKRRNEVIELDDDSDDEELLMGLKFTKPSSNKQTNNDEAVLASDSSSDVDADFTFTFDGRPLQGQVQKRSTKSVEIIDIPSSPEK